MMSFRHTLSCCILAPILFGCTHPESSRPDTGQTAILKPDLTLTSVGQPRRQASLYYEIYNLRSNCDISLNDEDVDFSLFFDGILNTQPRGNFLSVASISTAPLEISEIGDVRVIHTEDDSGADKKFEISLDITLSMISSQYRGLMVQQYKGPLTGSHIFDEKVDLKSTRLFIFPYSSQNALSWAEMRKQAQTAPVVECSTVANRR